MSTEDKAKFNNKNILMVLEFVLVDTYYGKFTFISKLDSR